MRKFFALIVLVLGFSVAGCIPPPPREPQNHPEDICIEDPDAPMCPWYPGYNPRPTCVLDIDCPIPTSTTTTTTTTTEPEECWLPEGCEE